MTVRQLTINDISDIKSCIHHHKTIYNIPIDHTELLNRIVNLLNTDRVYGYYKDGECLAIASQKFVSYMPFWILSNLYVKNNNSNLLLTDYYTEIISDLMTAGINYAETQGYYEFYYVFRDSERTTRKKYFRKRLEITHTEILERYEFENMHLLKSEQDVKWDYIRQLIGEAGMAALAKNKTLVIRRCRLKREAREI